MRRYLNEIIWVVVAQAATFLGALASVKIATTALGPGGYGRLAAALAVAGIVQTSLYGAISQSATRFLFLTHSRNSLDRYARSLVKLVALAAGLVAAGWLLLVGTGFDAMLPVKGWLVVSFIIASGAQIVLLAVLNAGRARRTVAVLQTTDAIVRAALILSAALFVGREPNILLGAYVVSSSIMALVLLVAAAVLRGRLATPAAEFDREFAETLFSQMLGFTAPFVVFGVVGALGSHGERLLLTAWVSWEQVGTYALMSQLAVAPVVLLTSIINQFYLPVIFQKDPDGTAEFAYAFRRYLLISGAGSLALAVAILASGHYIIPLFSTSAFLGYQHLLWLLVLSAGMFGIAQQLVLPGLRAIRPGIYIPSKLVHSGALLILAFFLVPKFGLEGMATASCVAAFLYMCSVLIANQVRKANT